MDGWKETNTINNHFYHNIDDMISIKDLDLDKFVYK